MRRISAVCLVGLLSACSSSPHQNIGSVCSPDYTHPIPENAVKYCGPLTPLELNPFLEQDLSD